MDGGGTLPKEVCRRLLLGVDLEDGPARALACRPAPGGAVLVLAEGRKREVRRMLQRVGYPVRRLLRLQVGPIRLGDLPPGSGGGFPRGRSRPSSGSWG